MLLNVGDSASSYRRLAEWCALSSEYLGKRRAAGENVPLPEILRPPPFFFPSFPYVRRTIPRNATALSGISNDLSLSLHRIIETNLLNLSYFKILSTNYNTTKIPHLNPSHGLRFAFFIATNAVGVLSSRRRFAFRLLLRPTISLRLERRCL